MLYLLEVKNSLVLGLQWSYLNHLFFSVNVIHKSTIPKNVNIYHVLGNDTQVIRCGGFEELPGSQWGESSCSCMEYKLNSFQ